MQDGTGRVGQGDGPGIGEGRPAAPVEVPEAPKSLVPGADPVYVAPGASVDLAAANTRAANLIELLPVGSDVVLLQRDVGAPPWKIEVRWPGAFRWRVASRDEQGLEGRPSADGGICVDEN